MLFPFKLLGLWLLASSNGLPPQSVFVLAKLVGVAVTAFVFDVTKPKLLQMAWFRWLYEHVLAWLDWAHHWSPRSGAGSEGSLRIFRANGPGARCGCCGASAAACARRHGRAASGAQSKCSDVRREQPNRHEREPEQAEAAGKVAQHHHAGDDGRRRQHDADLEGGRRELVVMVLGEILIALVLLFDGAPRQLDGAFALAAGRFGLGAVARRGLGPFVDLLGDRRLLRRVGRADEDRACPVRWRRWSRCAGCSWPGRNSTGSTLRSGN